MREKATILPIDPQLLDHYWPFVSSYIESAMEHADHEITLEDIRSGIDNHKRQLWVLKDAGEYIACVVTQICDFPTGRVGQITHAGGSQHKKWDHFVDVVGEWFKEQNCLRMSIIGRAGWDKLYRKRGFKLRAVELVRTLDNGQGQPEIINDGQSTGIS